MGTQHRDEPTNAAVQQAPAPAPAPAPTPAQHRAATVADEIWEEVEELPMLIYDEQTSFARDMGLRTPPPEPQWEWEYTPPTDTPQHPARFHSALKLHQRHQRWVEERDHAASSTDVAAAQSADRTSHPISATAPTERDRALENKAGTSAGN